MPYAHPHIVVVSLQAEHLALFVLVQIFFRQKMKYVDICRLKLASTVFAVDIKSDGSPH